jgi:hypothetical protein
MQTNEIPEDDFERDYSPTQYDFLEDIPEGTPLENIWTVVEGDYGDLFASPGYAFVNRLHYLVTEKPWVDETQCAEWMIYDNHEELEA